MKPLITWQGGVGVVVEEWMSLSFFLCALDRDVAALYDVETREVNQAVRNNPRKFLEGYVIEMTKEESAALRSKI